jgi:hypothetical protein
LIDVIKRLSMGLCHNIYCIETLLNVSNLFHTEYMRRLITFHILRENLSHILFIRILPDPLIGTRRQRNRIKLPPRGQCKWSLIYASCLERVRWTHKDGKRTVKKETHKSHKVHAHQGFRQLFIITCQATKAGGPGKTALHDPATWQRAASQPPSECPVRQRRRSRRRHRYRPA